MICIFISIFSCWLPPNNPIRSLTCQTFGVKALKSNERTLIDWCRFFVGSAQGPTLFKYFMRSPTGEVPFGGEKLFWKWSEKMHRVSFNSISGWLVLMQKRQNGIGFPEGRLDTCLYFWLKWDGLQTPEMQWRLRALPFLTGLTRGRVNLTSSEACFTATHSSWPKSRIYLSAIPFSANHPFPTSPPDRSSVDRRMNRGFEGSKLSERIVCLLYWTKLD